MTRNELAKLLWDEDGPTYTGWPNIGERVQWCYSDSPRYTAERARCFKLADAVMHALFIEEHA